jgi:hypothetical protein
MKICRRDGCHRGYGHQTVPLWGPLRDKVYSRKGRNVYEMKVSVTDAFTEIDGQNYVHQKVIRSVADRLQDCVNSDGFEFEHLRD